MLRIAIALFVIAALPGCAGSMNPQTRDEFRQSLAAGAPFALVETHVVNRRFEDVVKVLKQKSDECFNVDKTMQRTQGGITTMNTKDEYRTVVRVVNANLAEMTTQYHMKGAIVLQKVPEGGFYSQAVDIERAPANKTKLTYYGGSLFGNAAWPAIKQWSEGQASLPCP